MSFFQKHLFICTNERTNGNPCCAHSGGLDHLTYVKNKGKALNFDQKNIRVTKSGCLGRCDLGPAMVVYPEGVWYTAVCEADLDDIIEQHLLGDQVVERLCLDTDQSKENITK